MRSFPKTLATWPPGASSQAEASGMRTIELRLDLITPLYGGGATTREPASGNPFRGSGIRGQLRFWWRALARETDPGALREAETAIWGNMNERSRVNVRVQAEKDIPNAVPCCTVDHKGNPLWEGLPGYFLFPGQPQKADPGRPAQPAAKILQTGRFRLNIEYPADQEEAIINTLSAWLLFGGIGGRTRRGCGAMKVLDSSHPALKPKALFDSMPRLLSRESERGENGLPKLAGAQIFQMKRKYPNSLECWSELERVYRQFRQNRINGQAKVPGVSNWPEAGAIRGLAGTSYKQEPIPPESPRSIFPRGGLGLPIIFHFQQTRAKPATGHPQADPGDHSLIVDAKCDRWASPLLLKPVWDGASYVGLVIVLANSRPPDQLLLKGGNTTYNVRTGLHEPTFPQGISPMRGKTDVIEAFLASLGSQVTEVKA